jgi:hypothetical protein
MDTQTIIVLVVMALFVAGAIALLVSLNRPEKDEDQRTTKKD